MTAVQPEEMTAAIRVSANMKESESLRGLTGLSTEQKALISNFANHLNQNKAVEGLQSFASGLPGGWRAMVRQTRLTSFDQNGTRTARPGSLEDVQLKSIEGRTDIYERYQTVGFDNLTSIEKTSLINEIKALISSNPVLYEALKDANGTIPESIAIEMLKDKGVQGQLSEILHGAFSNIEVMQLEQDMLATRGEKENLEKRSQELTVEKDSLHKKLTDNTVQDGVAEKESNFSTVAHTADGKSKKVALESYRSNPIITEYYDLQGKLQDLKQQLSQLNTKSPAYAPTQQAIGDIQTQLLEYTTVKEKRDSLKDFQTLDAEWKSIQELRGKTEKRLEQVNSELNPLPTNIAQANAKLSNLESQRIQLAENFENTIKNALTRAVDQNMTSKLQKAINEFGTRKQAYKSQQQEAKTTEEAAAKAKAEKDLPRRKEMLRRYLDQRYIEYTKGFNNQLQARPNKDKSQADLAILLSSTGGPDVLAKSIIKGLADDTNLHGALGITAEDAKDMENSTELIASLAEDVPRQVLAAAVASGVPLSESTSRAILMTSWGENLTQPILDKIASMEKNTETLSKATLKSSEFASKWPRLVFLLILVALGMIGPGALVGALGVGIGALSQGLGGAASALNTAGDALHTVTGR